MSKGTERVRKVLKWLAITLAGLFVLFILLITFGFIPFDFAGLLLFGWIAFLRRVLPQMTFNPEIALDAAVALALALFGLHRILCAWTRRDGEESAKWRFGWTLKITVMMLLLFAASIAAVGMAHQIGWLSQGPKLIEMSGMGRQTKELFTLKQVAIALQVFATDHDGHFPEKLDELAPILATNKWFFINARDGDPPQRIIYYTGYSTQDGETKIVLASPNSFGGVKRAVAYCDGSAMILRESKYQEAIQKQRTSTGKQ
jgi:hypothetical protein